MLLKQLGFYIKFGQSFLAHSLRAEREDRKSCFIEEQQKGGKKRFLVFWLLQILEHFDRFGGFFNEKFKEKQLESFFKRTSGHIIPRYKIPQSFPNIFRKKMKCLRMAYMAQNRYPTVTKWVSEKLVPLATNTC